MECVPCNLCGTDDPISFLNPVDRFSGRSFHHVFCPNCSLIYLCPRPTRAEIANHYPADYEAYHLDDKSPPLSEQWHRLRSLDIQLDFVEAHVSQRGHLLDVGCATGNFMRTAKRRRWEVTGVELIASVARIAQVQTGLNVIIGEVETASLPEEHFDVITLWDVLEHLPDPRKTLNRCYQLLKPEGTLVFSIPNLESFDRYLFGEAWIGWDAPRHFYLFTLGTLEQMLHLTGFKLIARRCITGAKGAFFLNLDHILGKGKFGSAVKKLYPLISVILWPYRQVSYLLNKGPVMTFVARKVDG